MTNNNIDTILANLPSNIQTIQIPSFDDFHKIVFEKTDHVFFNEKYHNRNSSQTEDIFFLLKEGFALKTGSHSYKSYQDIVAGRELGFYNGDHYYRFLKTDCKSKEQLDELDKSGFHKLEDYREYLDLNLDSIYLKRNEILVNSKIHENLKNRFQAFNKSQLLQFIKTQDIQSTKEIIEFLYSGFESYDSYQNARSKGYEDYEDYCTGLKAGFKNAADYRNAWKIGITLEEKYSKFQADKQIAKEKGYSCFEFSLLDNLLNVRDFPKRAYKIKEIIKSRSIQEYGSSFVLSDEYLKISQNTHSLITSLLKEKPFKNIGTDPKEGIGFAPHWNLYKKVVVDASNVCWFDKNLNPSEKKLSVANLIEMKTILEDYGSSSILFIADANLPHEVDNPEILKRLEDADELIYSHGEKADKILISYSENRGFLIISNDQFRDWNAGSELETKRIGFTRDTDIGFDLVS